MTARATETRPKGLGAIRGRPKRAGASGGILARVKGRTKNVLARKVPPRATWTVAVAPGRVTVEIANLRLVSEMNFHQHWRARYQRKLAQQAVVLAALRGVRVLDHVTLPMRIVMTRVGPRKLDRDNLASAHKNAQDSAAHHLGIDDGDERLWWEYAQRKGAAAHEYGLAICFESGEVGDGE